MPAVFYSLHLSTLYWWKRQRYDVFKQEFGRYWPTLVTIEELKKVKEDVIVFEVRNFES